MSSPIDRSSDPNTISPYAPKWARDLKDEPSLRARLRMANKYFSESPANDSNHMTERGLHFKSLEPTLVPEPPMPESWRREEERRLVRGNGVVRMLVRVLFVVLIAAVASFAIALILPGAQRFAGIQKVTKETVATPNNDMPKPAVQSAATTAKPSVASEADRSQLSPTPAEPQPASPERLAATQPMATPAPAGHATTTPARQTSASSTAGKQAPAKTSSAQPASIDSASKSSAVAVTSVKTVPIRPKETIRPLNPDEIETLLEQGANFVSVGDFASARVVFGRVAAARDARGALALAATYDPVALAKINAKGATPDIAKAQQWYNTASELGSRDAQLRLTALENGAGAANASGSSAVSASEGPTGPTGRQPRNEAASVNSQSSDAADATVSYWKNDESIMRLKATGASRKFVFFKPSEEQMKAGAIAGSIRFDGQFSGKGYTGTAFSYSEKCGRESFPVSGEIENNGARVILSGKSAQMDGNCREIGKADQTLVFDFVEPSAK
jgi:TPR repeat protein